MTSRSNCDNTGHDAVQNAQPPSSLLPYGYGQWRCFTEKDMKFETGELGSCLSQVWCPWHKIVPTGALSYNTLPLNLSCMASGGGGRQTPFYIKGVISNTKGRSLRYSTCSKYQCFLLVYTQQNLYVYVTHLLIWHILDRWISLEVITELDIHSFLHNDPMANFKTAGQTDCENCISTKASSYSDCMCL